MKRFLSVVLCLCLVVGALAIPSPKRAEAADDALNYEIWQMLEFVKESGYSGTYPYYCVVCDGGSLKVLLSTGSTFDISLRDYQTQKLILGISAILQKNAGGEPYITTSVYSYTFTPSSGLSILYTNGTVTTSGSGTQNNLASRDWYYSVVGSIPRNEEPFTYTPPFVKSSDIDISMNKTEVSVTVPLNVACLINPNEEEMFTYGDLSVVNNSYAPVKLSLSLFTAVDDTKTMLTPDGLSEGLTWDTLNMENSAKYFSIGVRAKETEEWLSVLNDEYAYAEHITSKIPLGIIMPRKSGALELDAHFGKSYNVAQSVGLAMGFVAELAIE